MRKRKAWKAALGGAVACALIAACGGSGDFDNATHERRAADAGNRTVAPQTTPSQGPAKVDAHGHSDTARRISVTELRDLLAKGEAVAIDVRSPEAYHQAHIEGAILMPSEEVRARAKELPRDKLLVFYCA